MINQGLNDDELMLKLRKEARIKISKDSDYADLGDPPSRVLRSGGVVNDKAHRAWKATVEQRHIALYFGWEKDRYKKSDTHPFPDSYSDKEFEIPEDAKMTVASKWDLV